MKYTNNKNEQKTDKKEEKFDLQQCFTLWLNTSKNGNKYMSGYDFNHTRLIAFFNNKINEKQPAVRIYGVKEDGTMTDEIITLWNSNSNKGKVYLTGETNEKEGVIAFYGEEDDSKHPYIRGYFKKENN